MFGVMSTNHPAIAANLASWIYAGIFDSVRHVNLLDHAICLETYPSNQWDIAVDLESMGAMELCGWVRSQSSKACELIVPALDFPGKKLFREIGANRKQRLVGMQRSVEALAGKSTACVPSNENTEDDTQETSEENREESTGGELPSGNPDDGSSTSSSVNTAALEDATGDLTFEPIEPSSADQFLEIATWINDELPLLKAVEMQNQVRARIEDPGCRQYWIEINHIRVGTISLHDARRSRLWNRVDLDTQQKSMLSRPLMGIYDLSVDGRFRGRQIGGAALDWAHGRAAEMGFDTIFVLADAGLQTFYEKNRFRPLGKLERWEAGDGELL